MNVRSIVLGTTFLVVLLTAGAAQSLAGSNTVFSDDIANGNVTSADIKDQGVLYADLKDNAMTGKKMLDNSLTGADIKESTLVMPPVTGAKIADNSVTGADINAGRQIVTGNAEEVPSGQDLLAVAVCPAGTTVTGGGFDGDSGLVINSSLPVESEGTHAWQVGAQNPSPGTLFVRAYAICDAL